MTLGPGKYDAQCTAAREASGAEGAILIILGGARGDGFSAQLPPHALVMVPAILREVAKQIEDSGVQA